MDSGSNLQGRAFLLLKMLENSKKTERMQIVIEIIYGFGGAQLKYGV